MRICRFRFLSLFRFFLFRCHFAIDIISDYNVCYAITMLIIAYLFFDSIMIRRHFAA